MNVDLGIYLVLHLEIQLGVPQVYYAWKYTFRSSLRNNLSFSWVLSSGGFGAINLRVAR